MTPLALEMLRNAIRWMRRYEAEAEEKCHATYDRFYHGQAYAYGLAAQQMESILRLETGEVYVGPAVSQEENK
jgi:hypothetical protein